MSPCIATFVAVHGLSVRTGRGVKLELRPLQAEDADRLASEMQEAFQLAADQADEKTTPPVLPRRDIVDLFEEADKDEGHHGEKLCPQRKRVPTQDEEYEADEESWLENLPNVDEADEPCDEVWDDDCGN